MKDLSRFFFGYMFELVFGMLFLSVSTSIIFVYADAILRFFAENLSNSKLVLPFYNGTLILAAVLFALGVYGVTKGVGRVQEFD